MMKVIVFEIEKIVTVWNVMY